MNVLDWFFEYVRQDSDGCWRWTAGKNRDGYGYFPFEGRSQAAHRVAYKLLEGTIPLDLQLDHLCRVRDCVNPGHLEPVTCRENLLRGNTIAAVNTTKMRCPKNHAYIEENTYRTAAGQRV